jgi:hypothetical protein
MKSGVAAGFEGIGVQPLRWAKRNYLMVGDI